MREPAHSARGFGAVRLDRGVEDLAPDRHPARVAADGGRGAADGGRDRGAARSQHRAAGRAVGGGLDEGLGHGGATAGAHGSAEAERGRDDRGDERERSSPTASRSAAGSSACPRATSCSRAPASPQEQARPIAHRPTTSARRGRSVVTLELTAASGTGHRTSSRGLDLDRAESRQRTACPMAYRLRACRCNRLALLVVLLVARTGLRARRRDRTARRPDASLRRLDRLLAHRAPVPSRAGGARQEPGRLVVRGERLLRRRARRNASRRADPLRRGRLDRGRDSARPPARARPS